MRKWMHVATSYDDLMCKTVIRHSLFHCWSRHCLCAESGAEPWIIIIIIPWQCLWCCHHAVAALREFTLVHTVSAARRQVAADLWTKPIGLNHKPACRMPVNYTHHRHFIITQPDSWYSFYHPTEGRRLSRPSWLATYRDGLPARTRSPIQVLTGPGVE